MHTRLARFQATGWQEFSYKRGVFYKDTTILKIATPVSTKKTGDQYDIAVKLMVTGFLTPVRVCVRVLVALCCVACTRACVGMHTCVRIPVRVGIWHDR